MIETAARYLGVVSAQARPQKTGWPEDSPIKVIGPTSFSTRGLTALQKAAPRLRVLLENASPEDPMQDSPATQDEITDSAILGESTAPPSNAARDSESTSSDLELFKSVGSALGKYAIQNKIGLVIHIGPQPARYLTPPTPELFNLLGVALLSYGQKHHMGGCSVDQSCQATIDPPSNAAQESISSDVELLNSVGRALAIRPPEQHWAGHCCWTAAHKRPHNSNPRALQFVGCCRWKLCPKATHGGMLRGSAMQGDIHPFSP